jgi:hypothetical protein
MGDPQRQWEALFQVLNRWCTAAELEAITRRISAAELLALMKSAGSAEEIAILIADLKADQARTRWWRDFFRGLRELFIWFGLTGGALGAVLAARAVWTSLAGS